LRSVTVFDSYRVNNRGSHMGGDAAHDSAQPVFYEF
jgi:hypothetical protein